MTKGKTHGHRGIALLLAAVMLLALAFGLPHWLYPRRYAQQVESSAAEFGLDPLLVYAFIRTESSFDEKALSHMEARGLMQVTQETYEWIHSKLSPAEPLDFEDMYDPALNIRYGCYFVAASLARYDGDVATAAAAYHSGWGAVDALLSDAAYSADGCTLQDSPYVNMNHYMDKIVRCYARYQALYGGDGI